MTRRRALVAFAVLVLVALGFWQQWRLRQAPEGLTLHGETMGTLYTVRVAGAVPLSAEALRARLQERLGQLNATFSTWTADSEISRVNAAPAGTPITLSAELARVLGAALELAQATGGAFDPTVGPLVNLWGFGPHAPGRGPTAAELDAARRRTGYRHVRLEGAVLTKAIAGVSLDLSANAKGYAVDALARLLEGLGITDYVVDIGGDLLVRGHNAQGEPWEIGIELPEEGPPEGTGLQAVVRLESGALATSGTYRRFVRTQSGVRHHIIDPRTGRPTPTRLAEVSVFAPDCMTADGAATALMVLGVQDGLAWLRSRPGVSALFVEQGPQGGWKRHVSPGFPPLQPAP